MGTVLGIDAAWTLGQPSGVALAQKSDQGWKLLAAAPSYKIFCTGSKTENPAGRPVGSKADIANLLSAASCLSSEPIDLVAVDMPMAHFPIQERRVSDNEVSRHYGARHAGTHSPSALRPGKISDELKAGFEEHGYTLQTQTIAPPSLIEVYPHPALIELAKESRRLPYKASKTLKYWPEKTLAERTVRLEAEWEKIVGLLQVELSNIRSILPAISTCTAAYGRKAFEDILDAIICAWVGICALEGRAVPFGDQNSAIWIPRPLAS